MQLTPTHVHSSLLCCMANTVCPFTSKSYSISVWLAAIWQLAAQNRYTHNVVFVLE